MLFQQIMKKKKPCVFEQPYKAKRRPAPAAPSKAKSYPGAAVGMAKASEEDEEGNELAKPLGLSMRAPSDETATSVTALATAVAEGTLVVSVISRMLSEVLLKLVWAIAISLPAML